MKQIIVLFFLLVFLPAGAMDDLSSDSDSENENCDLTAYYLSRMGAKSGSSSEDSDSESCGLTTNYSSTPSPISVVSFGSEPSLTFFGKSKSRSLTQQGSNSSLGSNDSMKTFHNGAPKGKGKNSDPSLPCVTFTKPTPIPGIDCPDYGQPPMFGETSSLNILSEQRNQLIKAWSYDDIFSLVLEPDYNDNDGESANLSSEEAQTLAMAALVQYQKDMGLNSETK